MASVLCGLELKLSLFLLRTLHLRVIAFLETSYYLFDPLKIANISLRKAVLLGLFQLRAGNHYQPRFEVRNRASRLASSWRAGRSQSVA
jgi:hypothetical protein